MNLYQKSQLEQDLEAIQLLAKKTTSFISMAIQSLNSSYDTLWSLPDDRLLAVLQNLFDSGKLEDVFNQHNFAANSLNGILDNTDINFKRAFNTPLKKIQIQNGVVSFASSEENSSGEI